MDATTEEIRLRADIVEIVGQHVTLRPAGNDRWKACCPFHDEKTPSFYVSRDKGFYKCFGCGKAGDVFKFLIEVENITFPEAKRMLAERYGVELPEYHRHQGGESEHPGEEAAPSEREQLGRVMAASAAFYREQFSGNGGLVARDYARSRKLSNATIEKFGIGYAPDVWDALQRHLVNPNRYGFTPEEGVAAGMLIAREGENRTRTYDRFRHRLMFPIWDAGGRVIAFGGRALEGGQTGNPDAKYINSPESLLFTKSQILYGYHLARAEVGKRESVIVTEGYMDAIALHEAGFANTVATLGTALTTQHVALLRRLSPKIVYLCFDGDSAGMRAALRTAPLFAANNLDVRVVALPVEDDPDTFIKKQGVAGFENALHNAKLLMQYRVQMAVAEFDLTDLAGRKEGIRAGAEVIAEVQSATEKDSYILWLAEQWASAEGIASPQRLELVEAAVRREVLAAQKRWRKQQQAQRNGQEEEAPPENEDDVGAMLAQAVNDVGSGVVKAEKALLGVLLSSPIWQSHILKALPPQLWTQAQHREIAAAILSELGDESQPFSPIVIIEKLPEETASLIAELLLSDQAAEPVTDYIIDGWIERVHYYWARRDEQRVLAMIGRKIQNDEEITEEDRAAYRDVLVRTKRRSPPVKSS